MRFYTKMGYDRTKHNRRRVPRYRCRVCGKSFSTRTGSPTVGHLMLYIAFQNEYRIV